ncbi:MAG: DNA cytosine methyltransferase [Deltaproteobacteria bacterium]|jgi:DNA (cytosine-5)-methyltransferase 1|nr:DNA cytosine methyltransferase [Deltaproteobacteria bacterium]
MLKLLDLFAGAGGLSLGLTEAGFEPIFACDLKPVFMGAYSLNHPQVKALTSDIRNLAPESILQELSLAQGELDLLAGGPPCQGFSINAPFRSVLDERNHLFRYFLKFVEVFAPKSILIENVPGLVSFENGRTLDDILESLSDLGYSAEAKILGAAYYGVPQARWRTIIIGLRAKDLPAAIFPEPTYKAPLKVNFTATLQGKCLVKYPNYKASLNFVTIDEAIGDLPPLVNGQRGEALKEYLCPPLNAYQLSARIGSPGVSNHEAPNLTAINLQRLKFIKPGDNWTSIPDHLLPKGLRLARKSDHTKRYGRVRPQDLASTILTKCDPHWGAYFHYAQDRVFTVREAARIQSFPDRYVFTGSMADQYAEVGNAVPPLLAKCIGLAIRSVLEKANIGGDLTAG